MKRLVQLAGVIKPNDEQCHISQESYSDDYTYIYERLHDYPSLAQINRQVAENNMNIIFSVPQHVYDTYRDLQGRIQGSYVGKWSNNSDNLVGMISNQYNVGALCSYIHLTWY